MKPKSYLLADTSGDQYRLKWIDSENIKIRSKIFDPPKALYLLSVLYSNILAVTLVYQRFTQNISLIPLRESEICLEEIAKPDEKWLFSFLYYTAMNEQCKNIIQDYKDPKSYNMPTWAADWKSAFIKKIYRQYPRRTKRYLEDHELNNLLHQWRHKVYADLKKELKLERFTSKPYYIPKDFKALITPLIDEGKTLPEDLFKPDEAVSIDQLNEKLKPLLNTADLDVVKNKLKVTTLISLRTEKNELVLTFIDTRGSYFNLQPEKLIPLIKNANETKLIRPVVEKSRFNQKGVGQILGKLDPKRGMLIFIEAPGGERVWNFRDNTEDRKRFFINIDDILPYYIVIKKQFEEKIAFEKEWLRVQAEAHDIMDID